MPVLPIRSSLVTQTVEIIRNEILGGTWSEWLPGERALCEKYQVSRNTIRAAIARLKRDRFVRPLHGSGNQILVKSSGKRQETKIRDVALLAPVGLERLRPVQAIMIDELRALLGEHDCRLHTFHGARYFRADPDAALRKLLAQNPHSCWILLGSNAAIQKWFSENQEQCVVAGSVHSGLKLTFRDLDHRAICRHAAGMLLGLGHTRIALVLSKSSMAGDLESEAGMLEAIRQSNRPGGEIVPCKHDGTVTGIGSALRRLMALRAPPTALLVANAYHYLAVSSHLTQMGLRVPQDVSVIYVGGGHTIRMIARWRELGVDQLLRRAWANGAVLCGLSAGAICWFEAGHTDSSGGFAPMQCLGFVPGSCSPHYDGEVNRRPSFRALVQSGAMPPGYALDDGAAVHFRGREFAGVVSSRPAARGYYVSRGGNDVVETALDTRFLGP